jgi:hypothetical protein
MHSFNNAVAAERLRELLTYYPESGDFVRNVAASYTRPGTIAGWLTEYGYIRIRIDGENYLAHRLAFFYTHGDWPSDEIDHINGNRADNRISNLRLAATAQNAQNRRRRRDNKSGLKGVRSNGEKWRASIRQNGRRHHLGYFDTAALAHAAYHEAAQKLFGEFANDGSAS